MFSFKKKYVLLSDLRLHDEFQPPTELDLLLRAVRPLGEWRLPISKGARFTPPKCQASPKGNSLPYS